MTGKPESNRCYFCGGKTVIGTASIPFVIGNSVIVVKRVPAEVCAQCGEATVVSEVAEILDGLLKQVKRPGMEVTVVSYDELMLVPA